MCLMCLRTHICPQLQPLSCVRQQRYSPLLLYDSAVMTGTAAALTRIIKTCAHTYVHTLRHSLGPTCRTQIETGHGTSLATQVSSFQTDTDGDGVKSMWTERRSRWWWTGNCYKSLSCMEQRKFITHQQTKAVCDTFVRQRGQMCVRLIDGNI